MDAATALPAGPSEAPWPLIGTRIHARPAAPRWDRQLVLGEIKSVRSFPSEEAAAEIAAGCLIGCTRKPDGPYPRPAGGAWGERNN